MCWCVFQNIKKQENGSPEILMKQFLDNINDLQSCDIDCNGVKCNLAHSGLIFCFDAPIWSSLKKIVLHFVYKSCERCTVDGVYDTSRHFGLLETNCSPRNDQNFLLLLDSKRHKKTFLARVWCWYREVFFLRIYASSMFRCHKKITVMVERS